MLQATREQRLNDQDLLLLDVGLAARTWIPGPAAKRARVELGTAEVGRKTARDTSSSVNANSDSDSDEFEHEDAEDAGNNESDENDEFVRERDDSSGNGSDESDSDKSECQAQGNYRLEVDQYCENKDELQHDEQEEELNQGHANTEKKRRGRKPGYDNDPAISWDHRIRDLKDFKEKFGNCRVKQRFKDNPSLGRFVHNMRLYKNRIKKGEYSGSILTPARINELDELGFEWSGQQKNFEQWMEQLKAFKKAHGHLRVTHTLDENLTRLCGHLRDARWKRKPVYTETMTTTAEIIKALDDLGFEWTNVRESSFEQHVEQLRAFKESHGHLCITHTLDKKLASFCSTMIFARCKPPDYRGTMTMTEERIKVLDDLGFEWTQKQKHTFEQRVEQMRAFKELHGHLRVTSALDKDLAPFCSTMRYARRSPAPGRRNISEEQIKVLDDLGFEWGEKRRMRK